MGKSKRLKLALLRLAALAVMALSNSCKPALPRPTSSLSDAANHGDLEQIRRHQAWKTDVNQIDTGSPGWFPLYWAALGSQPTAIQMLADGGAKLDLTDRFGNTALHAAARAGCGPCVTVLIARGATVDARNAVGVTPLHNAVMNMSLGVVQTTQDLLDLHANPNAVDDMGATPLLCLWDWLETGVFRPGGSIEETYKRADEVGILLIHRGARVNVHAVGHSLETPLHQAARHGRYKLIEALAEAGADVNARDSRGKTVLQLAAERRRRDPMMSPFIIDYLIRKGARMD